MIQKITITLAALAKMILFGPARRAPSDLRCIAVAQMGHLGDMVCTTPVFRALKERYPGSEILVVGVPGNAGLIEDHPYVDGYYPYSGNIWELALFLRKKKPDAAVLCGPNGLVLGAMLASGIPLVCAPRVVGGYSPYETRVYKLLRYFAVIRPHNMHQYAPREYLRLLEPFGIFTDDIKKTLGYSSEAEKRVNDFLKENNIKDTDFKVVIAPSAGNKVKTWGEKNFAEVAGEIFKKYPNAKIFLIGGFKDKKEIDGVISYLNPAIKIINTHGLFPLDELKAFIAKANLLIAVDTGPIYIAEAFEVATIDIVGPIDEKEQPPIGEFNRIVKLEDRIPQLYAMNARVYDKKEARRQVENITPKMVIEAADDLMNKIMAKKS